MAKVLSASEVVSRLRNIRGLVQSLIQNRLKIDRIAKTMEQEGQLAVDVETAANAALTQWSADRDEIVDLLNDIPSVHQSRVLIGMPSRYTHARIEATNQSNTNIRGEACGVIRVPQSSEWEIEPFSVFQSGDVVSISRAEDVGNNTSAIVQHTPESASEEIVINGDFSSSSNWTETGDSGTEVTITGGQAVFSSATCTLSQAKADMVGGGGEWVNGHYYVVLFSLSSVSGGTLAVGTNTMPAQHTVTANADHVAIVKADNNSAGLIFTATGFTGNMDSVSVFKFNGLALNAPLSSDNDADSKLIITLEER